MMDPAADPTIHSVETIARLEHAALNERTLAERFSDRITKLVGSMPFVVFHVLLFAFWGVINSGWIPAVKPFDPFPFGLLTMIVSLEAIFLAIIVLISQNRAAKIAEIREEVDLQVNSITEGEVTKVIKLLMMVLEKDGINVKEDPELYEMLRPVKSADIERALEKQLG